MKYNTINHLDNEKFRRLTGVQICTFNKMIEILKEADKIKKSRGGRKDKLSIENQLLMALEYLREYRTYFHLGLSYDLSESQTYKVIKWIENTLIKHPDFSLPGKNALSAEDSKFEDILIDATEIQIQRPKKNKNFITQGKRKNIR